MLFDVAVKSPLRQLFTYESEVALRPGSRVRVPFGHREVSGFVWAKTNQAPKGLKSIAQSFDEAPVFDEVSLQFYDLASRYYGIPLGELLAFSVPKKIREGKPLQEIKPSLYKPNLATLSEAQASVVASISSASGFSQSLLQGETGSGKTEVYLQLACQKIKEGKQVLLLVPEISLTPQLEMRLTERLGASPAVFHSNRTEKERFQIFCEAHSGQPALFMGARSALFLPFQNLGMILVDEEHDGSYKQQERAPYHARDLAILRAKLHQIPLVLGSATPSLESLQKVKEKKFHHYRLPKYFKTPPIDFHVVDLKEEWKTEGRNFITETLRTSIEETLDKKEQVLLFLNRRGSHAQRACQSCGGKDECRNCHSTLTLHTDLKAAICHLCNYQQPLKNECSYCGSKDLFVGGVGTKEIEVLVKERFPEARVERIDRDRVQKKYVLEETLLKFAEGKIDILVGTQMISKGIDIPNLSLVGVVYADQGWTIPDFRALERSFQLLKQIEGRAGRRGQSAKVVFQTLQPTHPLFKWLKDPGGFEDFAEQELELRKMAGLPPFKRMALFHLMDHQLDKLEKAAEHFVSVSARCAKELGVEVVGPVMAPLSKLKNEYRMQVMAKALPEGHLTAFVQAVLDELEQSNLRVKVRLDRDPNQFM